MSGRIGSSPAPTPRSARPSSPPRSPPCSSRSDARSPSVKPAQTGVGPDERRRPGRGTTTGRRRVAVTKGSACRDPLAPDTAARLAGADASRPRTSSATWSDRVPGEHDVTFVEGAGGVLVHLGETWDLLDLADAVRYAGHRRRVRRGGPRRPRHPQPRRADRAARSRPAASQVAGVVIGSWPEHPGPGRGAEPGRPAAGHRRPPAGSGPSGCGGHAGPRVPTRRARLGGRALADVAGRGTAARTPRAAAAASADEHQRGTGGERLDRHPRDVHVRRQVDHPLRQPEQLAELTEGQERHQEAPSRGRPSGSGRCTPPRRARSPARRRAPAPVRQAPSRPSTREPDAPAVAERHRDARDAAAATSPRAVPRPALRRTPVNVRWRWPAPARSARRARRRHRGPRRRCAKQVMMTAAIDSSAAIIVSSRAPTPPRRSIMSRALGESSRSPMLGAIEPRTMPSTAIATVHPSTIGVCSRMLRAIASESRGDPVAGPGRAASRPEPRSRAPRSACARTNSAGRGRRTAAAPTSACPTRPAAASTSRTARASSATPPRCRRPRAARTARRGRRLRSWRRCARWPRAGRRPR